MGHSYVATVRRPAIIVSVMLAVLALTGATEAQEPSASPDIAPLIAGDLPPVSVAPVMDVGAVASGTLLPDQEVVLEATGSDGSGYRLVAPVGAVQIPTEITMTPLSDVEGLPFAAGMGAGVQLAPDGLTFDVPLQLKMTPAGGLAPGTNVAWDYLGEGDELALTVSSIEDGTVTVVVWHLSGVGTGGATSAELANQVRARVSDLSRAYTQAIAEAMASNDPGKDASAQAMIDRWWVDIVLPLWEIAATSCEALQEALQNTLAFERQVQMLGRSSGGDTERELPFFEKAKTACIEEIWRTCEQGHDLFAINRFMSLERWAQLLNSGESLGAWIDGCVRWEFTLESDAKVNGKGQTGGSITQENRAKGTVEFEALPLGLSSQAPGPWDLDVQVSGSSMKLKGAPGCRIDLDQDGVSGVNVETLAMGGRYETDASGKVKRYVPERVQVGFEPGEDESEATLHCKIAGRTIGQSGVSLKPWNQRWWAHLQKDEEGGKPFGFLTFRFDGSEVQMGDLFARKTYSRTVKIVDGAKLEEQTVLELWHRPKKPAGS